MTIAEMVEKAYCAADEMQHDLDRLNAATEERLAESWDHFGLTPVATKPFLSREEYRESMAQSMLLLLLKQAIANDRASLMEHKKC